MSIDWEFASYKKIVNLKYLYRKNQFRLRFPGHFQFEQFLGFRMQFLIL